MFAQNLCCDLVCAHHNHRVLKSCDSSFVAALIIFVIILLCQKNISVAVDLFNVLSSDEEVKMMLMYAAYNQLLQYKSVYTSTGRVIT